MRCPDSIAGEGERLLSLADYGLVAGVELPSLTPIVEMATQIFGVPAAAVNMIGTDHAFLIANAGVGECDMGRDISFCAHAITQDDVLVIADATLDVRFHDNPLVTSDKIRFYAGTPIKTPSGHALGALCIIDSSPRSEFSEEDRSRLRDLARLVTDRLELRRLEVAMKMHLSDLEVCASASRKAIICIDRTRKIVICNDSAANLFGYAPEEIYMKPVDLLIDDDDRQIFSRALDGYVDRIHLGDREFSTYIAKRCDGSKFKIELIWTTTKFADEIYVSAIVNDLSFCTEDGGIFERIANYDLLTSLPNRNLFYKTVNNSIDNNEKFSIISVDLHGIKDVNIALGYNSGDSILRDAARRMVDCTQGNATISRISGDEFAILLPGVSSEKYLNNIASFIIESVNQPMFVSGGETRISANCGVVIYPHHGETLESLIGNADLALRHAKSERLGTSFIFHPSLRSEAVARRLFATELHHALEKEEFSLVFQPQIRLSDNSLVGAEALLRWRHPVRNMLQPAAFLPALESSPIAADVGTMVLRKACAQAVEWRKFAPAFRIGVNLFAAQFEAGNLPSVIRDALKESGLDPEAIEIEITENIALDCKDDIIDQLNAIRDMGVNISFDDFGTGYASLNFLKYYPINRIKIDKEFTRSLQHSEADRTIVSSLIELSHRLGYSVIAEGIENEEQLSFLREHACEDGQGYLFGQPMDADLFSEKYRLADRISLNRRA
ncbi:EAL domain-containing protein [Sphingobium sp. TB-6]|uniref:putative bifunctional diguanylate cyclase/phosphodiesterase n=1 Tax=Sphingobium sp. TB-6 TaxID=2728850 RepID=UPI00146EF691|nr:EAL domain-containing protein [Sphingobium sp. TB-6]NML91282.1 EAL domain-containing protein [Sphingobium sp. TB-6]